MTALTRSAPTVTRSTNPFSTLMQALRRRAARQTTIRELQSLSDHELRDIGLVRSQIQSVAFEVTRNSV